MSNCVVFCMNNKFVKYTSFMIKQMFMNDVNIPKYILVDDTVEEQLYEEFGYCGAKLINICDLGKTIGMVDSNIHGYPPIVVSKLLIPFIDELNQYEKILYLDSDIQILKNFNPIFDIDLGQHEIGAVADHNVETWMSNYKDKLTSKLNGLTDKRLVGPYINSGVLLFNNKLIQSRDKEELKNRIKDIVAVAYKAQFDYADQDVFNLCFDICYLPEIWNVLYRFSKRTNDDVFLHHISNKCDFDKLVI